MGSYTKVSSFWTFIVPAFVLGLIVYVSRQPGWVGNKVHSIFGPVLDPIARWVGQWFC